MIDAEHSYFQPAIDHAAMEVQRQFNAREPVVYNTYQCYLKDSSSRYEFLTSSSSINFMKTNICRALYARKWISPDPILVGKHFTLHLEVCHLSIHCRLQLQLSN